MSVWAILLLPLLAAPEPAGPVADTTAVTDTIPGAPPAEGPMGPVPKVGPSAMGLGSAGVHRGEPPPTPARAHRPIRTDTPGTGVFIGSGLVVQALYDHESGGGEELSTWRAVADYRYTPATHWVFGIRAPWILDRRLDGPAAGSLSASGAGDVSLSVKHRFFRSVGMWSDRHMAAEVELDLPTGDGGIPPAASSLPVHLRHRLAPGSGGVGVTADLIYQEGRQRFVYGGDLSFRLNTEGDGGYRAGNEARLNLDLEYILFPLEYRRPGNEVFVLLETTIRRKWADEIAGQTLPETERTDVLLAPAVQHIISDQLLASLSVQVPVVSDAPPDGLEQDLNVLTELRYAF